MATRLPKANTEFGKLTDTDLATYAQAVHDGLASVAGLAQFPTPPVLPAALQTIIDGYVAALAAAVDGSKVQTATKNVERNNVIIALRLDALYVTQVAQAITDPLLQIEAINVSGYQISAEPLPKNTLPAPDEFTAKVKVISGAAQPGIVSLRYKRSLIRTNRGYGTKWLWKTVAAATWNEMSTSGASVDISGLTSGEAYVFKCVQIGNKTTIVTESPTVTVNVL